MVADKGERLHHTLEDPKLDHTMRSSSVKITSTVCVSDNKVSSTLPGGPDAQRKGQYNGEEKERHRKDGAGNGNSHHRAHNGIKAEHGSSREKQLEKSMVTCASEEDSDHENLDGSMEVEDTANVDGLENSTICCKETKPPEPSFGLDENSNILTEDPEQDQKRHQHQEELDGTVSEWAAIDTDFLEDNTTNQEVGYGASEEISHYEKELKAVEDQESSVGKSFQEESSGLSKPLTLKYCERDNPEKLFSQLKCFAHQYPIEEEFYSSGN
ncbi:uncharacterized protein [Aquarana catesbeiana]|uniref:uncharacterized protein n=1 Tax=Aquarana catesbeiana TaxID=8400 RepID=UPI003CCA64F0